MLLNAVMGYVQESRAESALAALRQMAAAHAQVLRDGDRQRIPAAEVVPGDIIVIEEGDTIPADPPDSGAMIKPPRPTNERVITRRMWFGIVLSAVPQWQAPFYGCPS